MKPDVEKKVQDSLDKKLRQLPYFVCEFIFSLEEVREKRTLFEYAKDIGLFLEFLQEYKFNGKEITDFTEEDIDVLDERDIRNFLSHLTRYKKTFTTPKGKIKTQEFTNSDLGKSRKIATLHEFFSYLFKMKKISRDVSQNVEVSVKEKKAIKDRLDTNDLEKFYSTIIDDVNIEGSRQLKFHQKVKFRDYIIVLILSYTGIRVSELVQLDVTEISIDKKSMIVERKGGDQERVPIPSRILEDIEEYLIKRKEMTGLEGDAKNAMFVSLHKKRIDPRTIRQMLDKYRIRANIDVKITPHMFRRTFGTRHYNKFRDMYLTAKIMGHKTAETTRKFYADPDEDRVNQSMEVFDYDSPTDNVTKNITIDMNKLKEISKLTGIDIETLLKAE